MNISVSMDPAIAKGDLQSYLADINAISGVSVHLDIMRKPRVCRDAVTEGEYQYIMSNSAHPIGVHCMADKIPPFVKVPVIPYIDLNEEIDETLARNTKELIVMSVIAGKSGQAFNPLSLDKVRALKEINPSLKIILDGGVTRDNFKQIRDAGVDTVVIGSFLHSMPSQKQRVQAVQELLGM